jgi:hypothetical protein
VALLDVVAAWLLVVTWFVAWEAVTARLDRSRNEGGWLRAPVRIYVVEALLLTLLATLWFASIGSGGWPLVFAFIGLLMEWPGPVRHGLRAEDGSWRAFVRVASGVVRVVGAAALVAWWVRG